MIHEFSLPATLVFLGFVAVTLALSFYLGRRVGGAHGYFAAHGQVPWFVNGIAFAGDYLSAASFLGICGMIAFYGYDGFLYSIGYLAGWAVALFVIAEPIKRLGRFTFADCLNARFHSRGIQCAVGISTLAVSIFYLIPQMVGAGVLIQPLLGLPHWAGVVIVGSVVILIVVTAGMVSTTWVQFLKGSLLIVFSTVLVVAVLWRGLAARDGGRDGYVFRTLGPVPLNDLSTEPIELPKPNWPDGWSIDGELYPAYRAANLIPLRDPAGILTVFSIESVDAEHTRLREAQSVILCASGEVLVNGRPKGGGAGEGQLHPVGYLESLPGQQSRTGPLGPVRFLATLQESSVVRWPSRKVQHPDGSVATVYFQEPTPGEELLRPGESPTFAGIRSDRWLDKVNFLSLMLALFCGTASLPHILIRYYTVKDAAAARKSTIVGIASIGFFYVLTLFLGLGAMSSGALDPADSNMAAPLLARSVNEWLFAVITAIAFTTVLGTVSGLILASAGAVGHDLVRGLGWSHLSDRETMRIAKLASIIVGAVAMALGILFARLNVNFLVGWAFSVAASANLPALLMLLFWRRTTRLGIIASVFVGMLSSLAWILLSEDTFVNVYHLPASHAVVPFSQPGLVTIPLSFATLIVVSLATQGDARRQ